MELELQRLDFQETQTKTQRRRTNQKTKKKPKQKHEETTSHKEGTNWRDQTQTETTKKVSTNPDLANPNRRQRRPKVPEAVAAKLKAKHFWVAISMVFFIAATTFTLLKICGDVAALGWWDLFINFGIAECFAFLVCTKWYNPAIHRQSQIRESCSSSMTFRYVDWNRGLVVSSDEDQHQSGMCNLQDIGGHVMKVPFIGFQILLFMRLEGTPSGARHMSFPVLFAPLFLLQGAGVLFAAYRLVEKIVLLLHSEVGSGTYIALASKAFDFFGFLHRGSRLLGWWSIDEGSREEQARLYSAGDSGYNTFAPDIVKKMPKSDLVEEIWRLQAALSEQTEITKFSQQEYERLQNEKILCRVCFEEQIDVVLLPCRHHILCSTCCEKCKKCPICRVSIQKRLPVYDV
ncbi:uncharacterized protein LOC126690866 isoform X2 [Quercus robur]|uniref:uncharacterized protein LOC126690866 isoform X2 n=1 Tax=Quercus robur TaxID=38942 RepID=UPI0021627A9B|nr:uncharacterized protein LOC126690866 isoform X2 [Quercus robur]